jgi:hypothetical protein
VGTASGSAAGGRPTARLLALARSRAAVAPAWAAFQGECSFLRVNPAVSLVMWSSMRVCCGGVVCSGFTGHRIALTFGLVLRLRGRDGTCSADDVLALLIQAALSFPPLFFVKLMVAFSKLKAKRERCICKRGMRERKGKLARHGVRRSLGARNGTLMDYGFGDSECSQRQRIRKQGRISTWVVVSNSLGRHPD